MTWICSQCLLDFVSFIGLTLAFLTPFIVIMYDMIYHVLKFFIGPVNELEDVLVRISSLVVASVVVISGGLGFTLTLAITGLAATIIVHLILGENWEPSWVRERRVKHSSVN